MKQIELAQQLGISKSYLSMLLSGQRRIPEHLEKPLCEQVHNNQLQEVPSKQRVVGSNPARDAILANLASKSSENRPLRKGRFSVFGRSRPAALCFSPLPIRAGCLSGGLFPEEEASMKMGSRRNGRWQDMDKGNISLAELIKYFDTYNRSEGKSPFTLRWYRQSLTMFLDWLTETDRPVTLGSTSENVVREFILYLRERSTNGRKLTVQTINSRIRALRAFFNWLYQKDYTNSHLLQGLKSPSLPKLMVETLSDEEIAAIFAVLGQSTMTDSRNTAIMALLLDSGLRLSELAGHYSLALPSLGGNDIFHTGLPD